MTIVNAPGHIVAFVTPLWGHNKSLCSLLAKIARFSRAHITYFTGQSIYDRALREINRQFLPEGEEHLKSLIRVIALPVSPIPFDLESNRSAFVQAYRMLCDEYAIPATPDGAYMHEAVRRPQLVLLDFFQYEVMKPIRSITGPSVPIYAWQSASVSGCICLFGPEKLDGLGDLAKTLETITEADEKARFDEAQRLYHRMNGNLLRVPGLPPMYDYEFSPQIIPDTMDLANFVKYAHRMFIESDGSIHASNHIYESPGLDAWAKWLPNGPVIPVAPLLPPPELEVMHEKKERSTTEVEVDHFLDDALGKYGENSVIYMSFGTIFWSTEPEKVWAVIDTMIELGIPFLFAHASPLAVVPEEIKEKVAKSGMGYMSNWLPQQAILRHKACGWFISHGGQNSIMESLTSGVPIIFWPYNADQPMNATNIAFNHNAAYELVEVRNGGALRPIHRLGGRAPEGTVEAIREEAIDVFTKARGEHGKTIRRNAQRLGKQLADYWAADGDGWKQLQRIVDVLN